jgi:AcrR family transcriptional regulator
MPHPIQTVSERKESEKELRRKGILHSAQGVFTKLGYHETTIEKIAQEAALGKGTVYYYYDNKEAILTDMMVDLLQSGVRTLLREISKSAGLRESLGLSASRALDFVIEHLSLWHVVQRELPRFRDKCPAHSEKLSRVARHSRRLAIRLLGRALRRSGNREDAEIIFDLISSQILGYAYSHFSEKKSRAAFHQKLQHSLDIIYRGIFPAFSEATASAVGRP